MLKIKKEKRVLDQRAKNLQFTTQKEVETLKQRLKEAKAEAKEAQDQAQQLSQENFELRQEL